MTIKELKGNKDYYFGCDLTKKRSLKEILNMDYLDEWGCAYVSLGEAMSVEYNLCIDDTTNENINESAIYKVDYNEEYDEYETDVSTFVHYEIDFDNPNWKKELENAMCKALIEFFEL